MLCFVHIVQSVAAAVFALLLFNRLFLAVLFFFFLCSVVLPPRSLVSPGTYNKDSTEGWPR